MTTLCPNCGLTHDDSVLTCDCGYDLQAYRQRRRAAAQAAASKHQFLAMAINLFWLLAALTVIGGLIYAVWLFNHEATWWALATLALTAISVYVYLAVAAAITLLIDLSTELDAIRQALGPTQTTREKK